MKSMEGTMDFEMYYEKASEYVKYESVDTFRQEVIQAMNQEDVEELHDRFYTELEFGTAGMRGVIGGGYNRMNPYIVSKVTQGLADYINEASPDNRTVVIACDSRNYSELFSEVSAQVLCANGIRVYLYDTIHPVPLLSHAVRYLGCAAGITITASHNPPKYNGYKVYWSDGGQVIPPHDTGIVSKVRQVADGSMIKTMSSADARSRRLLSGVPEEVDAAYYDKVLADPVRKAAFAEDVPCKVVYTPIHGSGNVPVQHLLKTLGVDYEVVAEQEEANGDFPTVTLPNPENPQAMSLAIELGRKTGADIILGTDPDSDRLGIGFPTDPGKQEFSLLNGNQIAVLLCDYLLATRTPATPAVCVKSIVTTDLMGAVAAAAGSECRDVLTGFKYIADQMIKIEAEGKSFIFGAEESFGYNSMLDVHDKDAVSSAILAVEMMKYHAKNGKSLQDRLEEIWGEFGFYLEKVISKDYPGSEGKAEMEAIMRSYREAAPTEIGGMAVESVEDLLAGTGSLPPADVIILRLKGGSKVIVRPSGTEPKIKFYLFSVAKEADLDAAKAESARRQQAMITSLGL